MLETPDISWFDLRKYDGLSELDLIGWHEQIKSRISLMEYISDDNTGSMGESAQSYIKTVADSIKINPIFESSIPPHEYQSTASVTDTSALNYWSAASDEVREIIKQKLDFGDLDDLYEMGDTPISELTNDGKEFRLYEMVSVDLEASDAQLRLDFDKWLLEQRRKNDTGKEIKDKYSTKKNFTDADFARWVKDLSLQIFDLYAISKFEGKELSKVNIANLLSKGKDFDVTILEKINKTLFKNAMQLITRKVEQQLSYQIAGISNTKQ